MLKIRKGLIIKGCGFSLLISLLSILLASIAFSATPLYQVRAQSLALSSGVSQVQNGSGSLSFYFQNIDLRTLLQLISKISGLNFVISDAVKGSVTLNLKNVTWQEALNIVLKTHGLTARQIGNVMFINTIDEISKMDMKEFEADEQMVKLAPLNSMILQLKYMNAKDLADILKGTSNSLLTSRGQIVVDPRTNSAIIRDVSSNLKDVQRLVKKLDVPARQVLIEARIVTIDVNYEKQLGIRFGLSNTRQLSGTWAGASQLPQGINVANVNPITDRLNFNNPAATFASGATPGSVGLALAHLGSILLDLELSALEEEQHGETISTPRLITSNQQKAVIQQGQQIPYQQATSSGATSIAFVNAVLSLEITPQITPDNRIVLKLKATEDSQGAGQVTSTSTSSSTGTTSTSVGPPVINTQEVESDVLLNNNETIVLGGIYQRTSSKTIDRIPFFGSLPVVGALFRFTSVQDSRKELLIFITPKIVESKPMKTAAKKAVVYKGGGGERG